MTTTGTVRPVHPEAEFALLRAAQEALANVARHARATRVGLTVSYMENEVAMDVRDDGVGFDPARPAAGFGLIADDHPVVRDGLSGMFADDSDFEVAGEAADGSQALRLAEAVRPDVILMDLRMPGIDGVTAIAELARRGNPARVLVLTTYDTDSYVLPAIEAGATGYLLKDAPRSELLRAVRAAAAGHSVLSPSVAARLMNRVRAPEPELLSQRELKVLGLVAAGTTNREAAARLFISEATVKTHLLHIYAKLGVADRAAAVAVAFNRGLLTPDNAGPNGR